MNARFLLFLGFLLIAFTVGCAPNNDELRYQRNAAIAQKDLAISQRDEAVKIAKEALARAKQYDKDIQNLVRQIQSSKVDEEVSDAIVNIHADLAIPIAEFESITGHPLSQLAVETESMLGTWDTFGTFVDLGEFGNKIVMMRHALYGDMKEDRTTLERIATISIIESTSKSQYAFPFKTFMEFPELDLVVFDAPSSLKATPLFLGEVDLSKVPVVSHIYRGEFTLYSQPAQISQIIIREGANASDNFMRVSGRLEYGDSGGPLVMKEDGKRKVVGFIKSKFNDKGGGGLAVKASSLLRKLAELESQRPQ